MALSQSDLLRLLESLRSSDGIELVRSVAERMLQELIEAEATAGRPGTQPSEARLPWWRATTLPIGHSKFPIGQSLRVNRAGQRWG